MGQLMARAARDKAQRVHDPLPRHHAHRAAPLTLQQRLEVAQGPDRHWQPIRLRPAVPCLLHTGPVIRRELGWTPSTRPVSEPVPSRADKAFLPDRDALGAGVEQPRDAGRCLPFPHQ